MKLQVRVLKASGLVSKDPNGKSDPYCCVYLGTIENSPHKTEVKYGTLNPVWNETFVIKGSELSPFLHTFDILTSDNVEYQVSGYLVVDVWDRDTINPDDFLGQVMIPLREVSWTDSKEEWYPLTRRNTKDKVSGSIRLEVQLKVDKSKIINGEEMNTDLYRKCKLRGYHIPIMSGRDLVELPGRTEKVEMAFSNVFVDISSNHCVAQVYLTNYRLVILSNQHSSKSGRSRSSSIDLSTWIALNNIMSMEVGNETIVVRKHQSKQKQKQKTTSITIQCYDVRMIKLIFALEEEKKIPSISLIPQLSPAMIALSANKQLGMRFKKTFGSPAIGKKIYQTFTEKPRPQMIDDDDPSEIKRTRSDAITHVPTCLKDRVELRVESSRKRSNSGDSATLIHFARNANDQDDFTRNVDDQDGFTRNVDDQDESNETESDKKVQDFDVRNSQLTGDISLTDLHINDGQSEQSPPPDEPDFCILTYAEPCDSETGGEYTMIFEETDLYLSDDEDGIYEHSENVKDLTPLDSSSMIPEGTETTRDRTISLPLPKPSPVLVHAFQKRIENVMMNSVDYPPGLFFVQLYEGSLQLTGWDLYSFPKEMDRQEVSPKWKLSVQNGPEYRICNTYPQLMYIPNGIEESVILESANFRSKNRFPCLVWVDSKRRNFMLRCAQPLPGKAGKHSLEDEQLIEACLNAGAPDSHMIIYDARSIVAATGNRLKGKGTENVTHYPRAKLTYLDIPNIHAVRESYDSLRSLCLSSESSKWYSSLENTQWLGYLSLIIKGAVMIARYMKLQRGNALVHCSDGWDRTSQLTSLAQIIMDPFYRTTTGFMILIEKEWLAFGHKFQHRLGHPDHPNERSPIFLQFLDAVYQMTSLFPKAFEFNSFFLLRIADHLNTGWFGTFLCNCDKERHDLSLYARSPSLWAHLMADNEALLNQEYSPTKHPIFPTSNLRHLKLWEDYFLRHDSSSMTTLGWRRELDLRDRQSTMNVQRTDSVFAECLQESWRTDHVIWMADDKTNECLFCHTRFTPFKRKHHCRACGHIFCDECSKNKIALSQLGYNRPERVCVECYSKLNAAQKTHDTDDGFLLVSCHDSI